MAASLRAGGIGQCIAYKSGHPVLQMDTHGPLLLSDLFRDDNPNDLHAVVAYQHVVIHHEAQCAR